MLVAADPGSAAILPGQPPLPATPDRKRRRRRGLGCLGNLLAFMLVVFLIGLGAWGVNRLTGGSIRNWAQGHVDAAIESIPGRITDRLRYFPLADRILDGVDIPAFSLDNVPELLDRIPDIGAAIPETQCPSPLIEGTNWGEREGGRSVSVTPSRCLRDAMGLQIDAAWAELIAKEPEADQAGMRDQLLCHMLGAPNKATWNLEPWRPVVGLPNVMRAGCNPT
jgi:hypothetical protein